MKYAVWNNKGGVGKTFLSFVLGTEIAHYKQNHVLLVDMCPQANLSEIVLGGNGEGAATLDLLIRLRNTIGGYFDERINSPQIKTGTENKFVIAAHKYNKNIPENVYLLAGDPSLEIQAQVISQISSQSLPSDSWKNVHYWLKDLIEAAVKEIGADGRDVTVLVDCNPSFSAYTELSMLATDAIIIPCSSDGSSARAIDNVGVLVYGVNLIKNYGDAGFSEKAKKHGLALPKIHSVILNRSTQYNKKASMAFSAMKDEIEKRCKSLEKSNPEIFYGSKLRMSDMPDTHSVAIVCSHQGKPLYKLSHGKYEVHDTTPQVNEEPLSRYKESVKALIDSLIP